jgi:hypothetical protein
MALKSYRNSALFPPRLYKKIASFCPGEGKAGVVAISPSWSKSKCSPTMGIVKCPLGPIRTGGDWSPLGILVKGSLRRASARDFS